MDRSVDEAMQVAIEFPRHLRPLPQQLLAIAGRALARACAGAGRAVGHRMGEAAGRGWDSLTAEVNGLGGIGIVSSSRFQGRHADVRMLDWPEELDGADMRAFGRFCAAYGIGVAVTADPNTGRNVILFRGRDADALQRAVRVMLADFGKVSSEQQQREGEERGSAVPVLGDSADGLDWRPNPKVDGGLVATAEVDGTARIDLFANPDGSWRATRTPCLGGTWLEGAAVSTQGAPDPSAPTLEAAKRSCWLSAHEQLSALRGPAYDAESVRQTQVMLEAASRFEELHAEHAARLTEVPEALFEAPDGSVFATRGEAVAHCASQGLDADGVAAMAGWMTTAGDLLPDRTDAVVAQCAIDRGYDAPDELVYARQGRHGQIHAPKSSAEMFAQVDDSIRRQGAAAGRGIAQTPDHASFRDQGAREAGRAVYEGLRRASEAAVGGAAARHARR